MFGSNFPYICITSSDFSGERKTINKAGGVGNKLTKLMKETGNSDTLMRMLSAIFYKRNTECTLMIPYVMYLWRPGTSVNVQKTKTNL